MKQYLALGQELVDKFDGAFRPDRTNTGTVSVFGRQIRFDLQQGFPLVTTKKTFLKAIIHELLWFLAGDTNINYLKENGVKIWDEWALPNGDLGPVYGAQWRSWPNPKNQTRVVKDIQERLAIAYHRVEMNDDNDLAYPINFTKDQLDNLARVHGLCNDHPQVVPVIHETLTRWGIPGDDVKDNPIDQIASVIKGLKEWPYSRRHIVSAWNVADLPDESMSPQANAQAGRMALASCHCFFQFYVEDLTIEERLAYVRQNQSRYAVEISKHHIDETPLTIAKLTPELEKLVLDKAGIPSKKLSCQLYQRSADYVLGVPFNIASYALLTMMVAQCVNMVPGEFIHTFGDLHIYSNHIEKFRTQQLPRETRSLPQMKLNPNVKDIFGFKYEDFTLEGYDPHPSINYGQPAV